MILLNIGDQLTGVSIHHVDHVVKHLLTKHPLNYPEQIQIWLVRKHGPIVPSEQHVYTVVLISF